MTAFSPGDRYVYINVHGRMINWIRGDDGVWMPDDGRDVFVEIDDEWMRKHIVERLQKDKPIRTPWAFVSVGGVA